MGATILEVGPALREADVAGSHRIDLECDSLGQMYTVRVSQVLVFAPDHLTAIE